MTEQETVAGLVAKLREMSRTVESPVGPLHGAGIAEWLKWVSELLEAALAASPDLERLARELHGLSCQMAGTQGLRPCDREPNCRYYQQVLAALQQAAATAWGRCPVTHEPHAWREPIETKNEQNILIALPACVNCHVLRSTLEPEATGSAVQTAWVDPETLDRTSG